MSGTKVVQINSECGRGSTGKIAVSISNLLSKNGIENYIYYSGNHRSDYPLGRMIAGKYSIRIHQLLSRFFGDQGFHSYFATIKLVKELELVDPDIIILHNLHGYYLHLPTLFDYIRRFNKPVYWVLHDCWPFTGHCTHFIVNKCCKWQTECATCDQQNKYPYSWFFDRSRELFRRKKEMLTGIQNLTLIAPSQWLANHVQKSFLKEYPVHVINNGIDLSVFNPTESDFRARYQIENKIMLLGVASCWSNYKGLDVFVELAHRLDSDRYQIVLVGTDEDIQRKLPSNIVSIRRTENQPQLAQIYSAADIFINPTREDNYPTVNMEALACGTPVITFDTGGAAEILGNGDGVVIKNNSIQSLIETIQSVYSTDYDSKAIAEAASRFSEKLCFEKYFELIM